VELQHIYSTRALVTWQWFWL